MGSATKVNKDAQVNLRRQLDFIKSISNPDAPDQAPVYPDEPIELVLKNIESNLQKQKVF